MYYLSQKRAIDAENVETSESELVKQDEII